MPHKWIAFGTPLQTIPGLDPPKNDPYWCTKCKNIGLAEYGSGQLPVATVHGVDDCDLQICRDVIET